MRSLALPSLLVCAACAPQRPAPPPTYPTLQASRAAAATARFEPASELVALPLACRSAEPAIDNALDDDCNGSIDGAPKDAPLLLALAYPRELPIALALRDSNGNEIPLGPAACAEDSAVCTLRLTPAALARGAHTLVARRDAAASSGDRQVLVSVQANGHVTTYAAALGPLADERALGLLALP